MAELKTKPTSQSVSAFLSDITDETRRKDCEVVAALMSEVTGASPQMWGPSIVGFGRYHYKYESGREGDWMLMGFSPRKGDLTLYILPGMHECQELLPKLGKCKNSKSCLYVKKVEDIDLKVLRQILKKALKSMSKYRTDK